MKQAKERDEESLTILTHVTCELWLRVSRREALSVSSCLTEQNYRFLGRFSWGILYAFIIGVTSILTAVLLRVTTLLPNSDIFLLFLILFEYGLSIITFSFMLTPFFSKAEVINTTCYHCFVNVIPFILKNSLYFVFNLIFNVRRWLGQWLAWHQLSFHCCSSWWMNYKTVWDRMALYHPFQHGVRH